MKDFDILANDNDLNELIDNINEKQKSYLYACHGRYHTEFVVEKTEKILKELGYDKRIVELGKIAALLHDIGVISGKENHPKKSSLMCVDYLDKTNLTDDEKQVVIEAIFDHSRGENITSPIGAVLILVDKISLDKNRVLELGCKDEEYFLLSINRVDVYIEKALLKLVLYVNEKFSKDKFEKEWSKGIKLIYKTCLYLGISCKFEFVQEG